MPAMGYRGLWKTTREVSGGQKCGQKMRSSFKKTQPAPLPGRQGGRPAARLTRKRSPRPGPWQRPPDPVGRPGGGASSPLLLWSWGVSQEVMWGWGAWLSHGGVSQLLFFNLTDIVGAGLFWGTLSSSQTRSRASEEGGFRGSQEPLPGVCEDCSRPWASASAVKWG